MSTRRTWNVYLLSYLYRNERYCASKTPIIQTVDRFIGQDTQNANPRPKPSSWSCSMWWVLLLCLQSCFGWFSNNSEIEQILETEIIYLEPRSFAHKAKEFLVVRQEYAKVYKHFTSDGKLIKKGLLPDQWGHMAYL